MAADDIEQPLPPVSVKHYFVDETGDGTLFDGKGRGIVGEDGCSRYFAIGVLDIRDPDGLSARFRNLRQQILNDPFFSGVPSLKPENSKTAIAFHAKNDIPEIRQLVFRELAGADIQFFAVIRDKAGLAVDVKNKNQQSAAYHYHPNKLYDEMVRRLFKNRLHKDDAYRVCFATRGQKDRTRALRLALEQARENFRRQWGIDSASPIEVTAMPSEHSEGLQAADYFLWALQRAYVKGEDRFLRSLWPKVGLIHDVDDRRNHAWGEYYNQKKPLTADCLKK